MKIFNVVDNIIKELIVVYNMKRMSDECKEFTILDTYDSWVVPHQALPFIATIIGIEWKEVFLIMYVWETIEVVFLNCIGIAETENISDALISDPVQGLFGVMVGELFIKTFNGGEVLKSTTQGAYLWSILFILVSIPVVIGGGFVWGYLPIFICFSTLVMSKKPKLLIATYVYVTLLNVVVYATKGVFNSFYGALLVGGFTLMVTSCLHYTKLGVV